MCYFPLSRAADDESFLIGRSISHAFLHCERLNSSDFDRVSSDVERSRFGPSFHDFASNLCWMLYLKCKGTISEGIRILKHASE